ncbi:glutamate receptor U1-like [Battus philenor]|uniref:glutamate receptor U1-like n=1 Tax=Battus philenor TaxID=42288 RepID=UPI0035CE96A2
MGSIEPPHPVEARKFMGEQLLIGHSNSSEGHNHVLGDDFAMMYDVLDFLTIQINATPTMRHYNNLGLRTFDGTWTGLLGALMDNSIDIALEPVMSHAFRYQDTQIIFPIAETMFNIYIRDQETSAVRNIFLTPFNSSLLGCVFVIALLITVAILLISNFTPFDTSNKSMAFTEALIWSTGILCQQGSSRSPSNPSASVLLIVCLLFALIMYSSYTAFITSVLSVRVASVDTVTAVLQSPNLKIGYIRNGPDQMYLMLTKDAKLNAFYIRGYADAENLVSSAEEGLLRAIKQDYAFFSEQRMARSALRSLSQACGRCSLRELVVPSTRAHLAFPISRDSPYARPFLVSFLQLRSSGVLMRLEKTLVPAMPRCTPPPRFTSARYTDVRSALMLFSIGIISSLLIGIAEYFWSKRDMLKECIGGYCRRYSILFFKF